MLSQAATPVVAPSAVMWTARQVAERDGVTPQAVTKLVRRFAEDHALTVQRNPRGAIIAFNVAEYDHLRGRFGDPSKDQRELLPTKAAPNTVPGTNDSYDEARRRNAWLDHERARIALAEQKRELLRARGVVDGLAGAGSEIARILDRMANAADDMANAVSREGVHGARVALKSMANRMRTEIADVLAKVAISEPLEDEAVEPIEQ